MLSFSCTPELDFYAILLPCLWLFIDFSDRIISIADVVHFI